jgi:predicted small lipoprotein YifL
MLIAATSLLLLTGCGQKGPLFLPQDQNLDKPAISQGDKPAEQPSDQ